MLSRENSDIGNSMDALQNHFSDEKKLLNNKKRVSSLGYSIYTKLWKMQTNLQDRKHISGYLGMGCRRQGQEGGLQKAFLGILGM